VLGERIYQSAALPAHAAIDLSAQPKGIYFMEVMSEGNRQTKKIILE